MKKSFSVLFLAVLLSACLYAQSSDSQTKELKTEFFSEEVPRYEGFAGGAFFTNQYAIGGWSDYAAANLGCGIDVEYTLPHFSFLPATMDLGVTGSFDYSHTFPKKNTTLKNHDSYKLYANAFARLPFMLFGQKFAIQAMFGYGININHAVGQNGSKANGCYVDQMFVITPALRYIAPVDFLNDFEFELAPYWVICPEKNGNAMNDFGFRIGAVWHFDGFLKSRLSSAEKTESKETEKISEKEKIFEDEKALREEMQQELERVLADPQLFLGVDPDEIKNFTPDGDGNNDEITFHPATKYMNDAPETWKLEITDPKGKVIRDWSGTGYPPEEIVWDGKDNNDAIIFSREKYNALLSVKVCELDCERLGRSTLEATIDGDVTIETGIIMTPVEENVWKIACTSLTFDSNAATFNNLSKEKREELDKTLDEITERVLSLGGANVTVEGYANNISGTEKENIEDLIPLSQLRAESIARLLVERGIDETNIKAVGMGGANPIASHEDRENWWKNRRIEFVIRK